MFGGLCSYNLQLVLLSNCTCSNVANSWNDTFLSLPAVALHYELLINTTRQMAKKKLYFVIVSLLCNRAHFLNLVVGLLRLVSLKQPTFFFGVAELCFFALEFDGTFTSPQKNQTFQANKSEFDLTGLVYVNLHIIHLFIPLSKFNKNKIRIIACFLNICFSNQLGCPSSFNIFDKLLGLRPGREL